MNKAELVAAIAARTGQSQDEARKSLDAFTAEISHQGTLGVKVQIQGFGSFEVSHSSARQGRNPATGASMQISAKAKPKFTAADAYQTSVNKAQARV
jgi:DNA-binding protein HU-beta